MGIGLSRLLDSDQNVSTKIKSLKGNYDDGNTKTNSEHCDFVLTEQSSKEKPKNRSSYYTYDKRKMRYFTIRDDYVDVFALKREQTSVFSKKDDIIKNVKHSKKKTKLYEKLSISDFKDLLSKTSPELRTAINSHLVSKNHEAVPG